MHVFHDRFFIIYDCTFVITMMMKVVPGRYLHGYEVALSI